MLSRKENFAKFLNNETPEWVPAAFWHHFVSFHNHHRGLHDEEVLKNVYEGQKEAYKRLPSDCLKIMSDGFFGHPAMMREPRIETVDDLKTIKHVGPDHPWIEEQVKYVKEMVDFVDGEVHTYYNVFSPLQYIRLKFEEYDEDFEIFSRLFFEDKDAMIHAAEEIAQDVLVLVDRLFEETALDGIYYSVQCVQDKRADREFHDQYVKPLDLLIMNKIREYNDNIIIHICGYGHYTNELEWFADYPAKVFNWATHTENVSLAEGKKIFHNKPVLGGFDNNAGTLLYNGTKEEIQAFVRDTLEEAGTAGICFGADCTVSEDIEPERIQWIRDVTLDV